MADVNWHYSSANLFGCSGMQMNENLRSDFGICTSLRYNAVRSCRIFLKLLVILPFAAVVAPVAVVYYPIAIGTFLVCSLPSQGGCKLWRKIRTHPL